MERRILENTKQPELLPSYEPPSVDLWKEKKRFAKIVICRGATNKSAVNCVEGSYALEDPQMDSNPQKELL